MTKPPTKSPSADAAMLAVAVIWGLNFSVMKGAFAEIPPLAFTAVRFAIGSALLVPLSRRLERSEALPPGVFWRLVVLGVVGNTLYQLGLVLGLARTTASNTAVILTSVPAVVAVLAVVLGIDPRRARVFWGIGIATAGVVLVVAVRGAGFSTATLAGDLLSLSAVFCWTGYTLGLRRLPPDLSPLQITTVATVAGTPGLVLAGLPELVRLDWGEVAFAGWAGLAYSTLLSLVVAYVLWNRSVQAVGPSRTVVYLCLTPIVAVAAAWLLLGERPHPLQGVGAILVVAGVLLTRRSAPPPTS